MPQPAWPADKVERRPLESLTAYARNARTHSDEQISKIAASMKEWGWTNPVLVDEEGGIIAGHGRVLAAKRLGITEAPVMVATGWSDAQRRAYVIADNQLAISGSGWDNDLLKIELADLQAGDFDLSLTGFNVDEIAGILVDRGGDGDPEATPEVPADPVSELGDVWVLGRHRLMAGSSTSADDVARLLGPVRPHLMVTDPPYGVNYDPQWRNEVFREDGSKVSARATGTVLNDDRSDWREAWALFPGDVVYVWHGALHAANVAESLEDSGFHIRSQIIWRKHHLVIGRGDYHWQHEPCWYAVKKGRTGHYAGGRKQSTIWEIEASSGYRQQKTGPDAHTGVHSTQKPVECMRRPIENNSSPGQAVYEPFSGSFTTGIAAEMTGRSCLAMELNPAYVDLGVLRWQGFAGGVATLEETGETFAELMARRRPDQQVKVTAAA
jgi:DNA modification methylase